MRSVSCLLLYHFYATVAGYADPTVAGHPYLVVRENEVVDISPAAEDAGLFLPTTLRQARHACPSLQVTPYRDDYVEWIKPIWDECASLTPLVEPAGFDRVYLDFTGCGPLEPLIRKIEKILDKTGFTGCLGIAGNKFTAEAAADTCLARLPKTAGFDTLCVKPGEEMDFISTLPLNCLNLPAHIQDRALHLGLYNVGQFLAIPREILFEQLGSVVKDVFSMLFGEGELVKPVYPPASIEYAVNMERWGGQITEFSTLHDCLYEAASHVSQTLHKRGQVGRRLELVFQTESETFCRRIELKEPVNGGYSLWNALKRAAELSVSAPLTGIKVRIGKIEPMHGTQLGIFEGLEMRETNKEDKVRAALNLLETRFGPHSIKKASSLPLTRREKLLLLYHDYRL